MLIFSLLRLSFYSCAVFILASKYAFAFSSTCLAQYERVALLSPVQYFPASFKLFFCTTGMHFVKQYPKSTGGKYPTLSNPGMIQSIMSLWYTCATFRHSCISSAIPVYRYTVLYLCNYDLCAYFPSVFKIIQNEEKRIQLLVTKWKTIYRKWNLLQKVSWHYTFKRPLLFFGTMQAFWVPYKQLDLSGGRNPCSHLTGTQRENRLLPGPRSRSVGYLFYLTDSQKIFFALFSL